MTLDLRTMVVLLLFSVGLIAWWRGVWDLLDIYIFPKRPILSNAVTVLLGGLLMIALVLLFPDILWT